VISTFSKMLTSTLSHSQYRRSNMLICVRQTEQPRPWLCTSSVTCTYTYYVIKLCDKNIVFCFYGFPYFVYSCIFHSRIFSALLLWTEKSEHVGRAGQSPRTQIAGLRQVRIQMDVTIKATANCRCH